MLRQQQVLRGKADNAPNGLGMQSRNANGATSDGLWSHGEVLHYGRMTTAIGVVLLFIMGPRRLGSGLWPVRMRSWSRT